MNVNIWVWMTGLLGLFVGSFLNVVISRLYTGESFLGGRSHCPHCKMQLKSWDLVPVLSFFFLLGKCRGCRKPISWQYPGVEILTGIVFGLTAWSFGLGSSGMGYIFDPAYAGTQALGFIFALALSSIFIVIGIYDIKYYIILDKVVLVGFLVAVGYAALQGKLLSGLIGAAVISGFFFLQYIVSRTRWIGLGDVKYGLLLGMSAGFPVAIVLLFLAYILGAVTGVGLIVSGKKELGSRLPFGAFLSASAIICLYFGHMIAAWYADLIGLNLL